MTKDAVNLKTKEKVDKVEALLKELQLSVSPKEIVTKEGFIERVVYYMDSEAYSIDPK